jgi:hypothetical protein
MEELLWAEDENISETEHSRILKVERKSPFKVNIKELLDKLKPICRFDTNRLEMYRNIKLLRNILKNEIMLK